MLLMLESHNRILEETVRSAVLGERRGQPLQVQLCDFDETQYTVSLTGPGGELPDPNAAESPSRGSSTAGAAMSCDELVVTMKLEAYQQVAALGADDELAATFGDLVATPPAPGTLLLKVDLSKIPDENKEELVQVIANFKDKVAGAPFRRYLDALHSKTTLEPASFALHPDMPVFIVPRPDRVLVFFSLNVKERADRVVTSVFLTEFVEARRNVATAPIVSFGEAPPKELQETFGISGPIGNVGFITFGLLPRHVASPKQVEKAASLLMGFRSYIQYHIKCSKAYFHQRMRARVTSLLQVLNRAKNDEVDDPDKVKTKKTFSGRTFQQK